MKKETEGRSETDHPSLLSRILLSEDQRRIETDPGRPEPLSLDQSDRFLDPDRAEDRRGTRSLIGEDPFRGDGKTPLPVSIGSSHGPDAKRDPEKNLLSRAAEPRSEEPGSLRPIFFTLPESFRPGTGMRQSGGSVSSVIDRR